MAVKKRYLPVNWVDGMKINKEHFIVSDQNNIQRLKNVQLQFLNAYNYGIVLPETDGNPSLKLSTYLDNQGFVHVKVLNCHALTRDGSGIDIDDGYVAGDEYAASLPEIKVDQEGETDNAFYISLAVTIYSRNPFGPADPDETPPRLPFVIPGYRLTIHSSAERKSIRSESSLIVGKLVYVNRKPELDESYIPPCQSIYCHPKLAEYHSQVLKILGQVEVDLVNILQGIKEKKQSTSIAGSVAEVAQTLLSFLGANLSGLRRSARFHPPVHLFEQISSIARLISNTINTQSRADREELLNYIADWSNLRQGEFEDMIKQAVEIEYDHDDINLVIAKTDPFLRAISKIFNSLSNLEFIGKKKDRQIFVKEQTEKPAKSFLVD
jgi:predicted component of type VI protein secretion system